jgi:hypothetical protein
MAVSTSNVALTSIAGVAGGVPSALAPTPYPEWLDRVKNANTPLLQLITKAGPPDDPRAHAAGLTWGWSSERILYDQLNASYTSGGVTLTVDNNTRFQIGDIVKVEDELFLVTAYVSTTGLTVVGAQGGTSAANHSDNVGVMILGNAFTQNQTTTIVPIAQGEVLSNPWQQMEYKLSSSHQREIFDSFETRGKGSALNYFMKKLLNVEGPKQMERALIHNLSQAQTASVPGIFGGINQPAYTQNRVSVSGALTFTALLNALESTWLQAKDGYDTDIMGHPRMMRRLSSYFSNTRQADATGDTIRLHFQKFISPLGGTLRLISNPNWVRPGTVDGTPEKELNSIMIANFSDFKLRPASSDSTWKIMYRKEQYNDAWQDVAFLRGLYSLEAQNIFTRTYLYGFSTTDSDYPGMI